MLCKHLQSLERDIIAAGIRETFRGKAWADHCREWVYFDCMFDVERIKSSYSLSPVVVQHEHYGTHDGQELGLVCTECHDGIMGYPPGCRNEAAIFPL